MSRASFALKESLYLRLEISNKYLMSKEILTAVVRSLLLSSSGNDLYFESIFTVYAIQISSEKQ